MRLAKYLAHCGVASRRAAEKLIAAGRVTVGGEVVTDPARDVDADSDVAVDGTTVLPEAHETWALNKPLDVTSTAASRGDGAPSSISSPPSAGSIRSAASTPTRPG